MRFTGKLIYRGQIVLDPATGDLWETTATSRDKEWGGHFDPTNAFVTGSDYELVLNDGRCGLIVVGSVPFILNKPIAVSFRGLGPLK